MYRQVKFKSFLAKRGCIQRSFFWDFPKCQKWSKIVRKLRLNPSGLWLNVLIREDATYRLFHARTSFLKHCFLWASVFMRTFLLISSILLVQSYLFFFGICLVSDSLLLELWYMFCLISIKYSYTQLIIAPIYATRSQRMVKKLGLNL